MLDDLRLAIRHLARRPGFAAAALLLLAVGTGANAAVFSVVNAVVWRPLPFHAPERLVAIWPEGFVAPRDVETWRDRVRELDGIATMAPGWMMALVADGLEPRKVVVGKVSGTLFPLLGTPPRLGRAIAPGDTTPGRHRVALLSHGLWRRAFAEAPDVVGRIVRIDDTRYEVIGVMPADFEFREPATELWIPQPDDPSPAARTGATTQAIGRLAPGATAASATAALRALLPAQRAEAGYPDSWAADLRVEPLREAVVGMVRPALVLLLGAVGLLLVLASVNIGTLVAGRVIERLREFAVRSALGASAPRLVREIAAEQLVLALAGGAAGLLVAHWLMRLIVHALPPDLPRAGEVRLDAAVFAVTLMLSTLVAAVVALAPAAIAARVRLDPLLRLARSTAPPTRVRALGALVIAQLTLAVVLGGGAGLALRSVRALQLADPGFVPDGVLSFRLQTTARVRTLGEGLALFTQIVERIRGLPGVDGVGAVQHLPMSGYAWTMPVRREHDPPAAAGGGVTMTWRFVGWDYFAVLRIPIVAGRRFGEDDRIGAAPVALLNQTAARQLFGSGEAAIGRVLLTPGFGANREDRLRVVGVVGDVRQASLAERPRPQIFRPFAQTFMFPMAFVVRTAVPPASLAAAVREAVWAIDPAVPVAELQPLPTLLAASIATPRLVATLLGVFAAAGLLIAAVGAYAVVAATVRQREREIGIRLAVGAAPAAIARHVLRQGLAYAAAAVALGVPAALLLGRVMRSLLVGVGPGDPVTWTAVPVAILVTTAAACWVPARRAARVDPVQSLRAD